MKNRRITTGYADGTSLGAAKGKEPERDQPNPFPLWAAARMVAEQSRPRPADWKGVAVSMIGNGHIRREMPCQDASAAIVAPRPALIVCDGRGSAKAGRSQDGSRMAVRAFCAQLNVLEPMISDALDRPGLTQSAWRKLCKTFYRTLVQAKLECSADSGLPENEFDFTAAFAIVGGAHVGCFQVGDGALVLRHGAVCETVFKPMKGEFANLTQFVRSGGDIGDNFQSAVFTAADVTGVAATSDGPQHLMFNLAEMTPGPVFPVLIDRLASGKIERDDVVVYLSRRQWADDPRGDDDRSIALLCKTNPVPEEENSGKCRSAGKCHVHPLIDRGGTD